MSSRRILGIVGEPMNGVTYVRFFQPFGQLEPLGYDFATLGRNLTLTRCGDGYRPADTLLDGVDAVVFPQSVASPQLPDGSRVELVAPICDYAAERGVSIVYSVDDHLGRVESHNPAYDRLRDSVESTNTILKHADAIFVTTPALRDSLQGHHKPMHLLPNAIDPGRWTRRPQRSDGLRIGWAGSSSHLEDLGVVVEAVRELQKRVPVHFVIQGIVHGPIREELARVQRLLPGLSLSERATAEAFVELARSLEEIDCTHVPFTSMEEYFDVLPSLDLDIGLCPLLDTPFNRHRSALKFYEYAMCGTMTVASDVGAYKDEVSVTVPNDARQWCDTLERYLLDPHERQAELERQRDFVLTHRDIRKIRYDWDRALDETLAVAERTTCP